MAQPIDPALPQKLDSESGNSEENIVTESDLTLVNKSEHPGERNAASPSKSLGAASGRILAEPSPLSGPDSPRSPHLTAQPFRRTRTAASQPYIKRTGQWIELAEWQTSGTTTLSADESSIEPERRSSKSSTRSEGFWTVITGSWVTTNAEGTRSLALPSSTWGYAVLLSHYIFILLYSISSLILQFLQVWNSRGSNLPNSAQETLTKMQQTFGDLAHEDAGQAKELLAKIAQTLTSKVDDAARLEAKWEEKFDQLNHLLKACVGYAKTNLTGTSCEKALQSLDFNSTSSDIPRKPPSFSLTKRKLAEIDYTFKNFTSTETPSNLLSTHSRSPLMLVLVLATLVLLLIVSTVAIFSQHRNRPWMKAFLRALLPKALSKPEEFSEKLEPPVEIDDGATTGASTTIDVQGYNGTSLRRNRLTQSPPGDIWSAAALGDLKSVEYFRKQANNFNINESHSKYGSFLTAASRSGKPEVVAQFIVWGADPNTEGGDFHNPLQAAAHSGNMEIVRMLLRRNARDNTIGGYYGTAVNAAAEKGSLEMVQELLKYSRSPAEVVNVPGGLHGKGLVAAAFRGQKSMVSTLLGHGADVNGTNETGTTPLHAAAAGNSLEIVRLLLENGSTPDLLSSTHATALHAASRAGHEIVALALIEHGANPQIEDENGRQPLHEASKNGLSMLVKAILTRDESDANAQDSDGNTALHHAAIGGHVDVTATLLKHGADVSIGDKYDAQPLFRAAGCHHADVVDLLLQAGADPNARDRFGQIALHGPSETDDVRVQELLIEAGSNINAFGAWNRTPLYEACSMGKLKNVKLLLSRPEINLNTVDDHHGTPICRALCSTDPRHKDQCVNPQIPLFMVDREDLDVNLCNGLAVQEAANLGMFEVFEKMVTQRKANVHVLGGKYGGLLQAAAIGGNLNIINLLLERRVNVNQQGGEYGTPLAAACAFGHVAVVKELLEHGADPKVRGGRYGSAFASVGQVKIKDKGRLEMEDIMRDIRMLLKEAGEDGLEIIEQPHLTDRWHDTTGGWRWIAKGEM